MTKDRAYTNFLLIKALEETDESKAIEAVSNPELDGQELSEIIAISIRGMITSKKTGTPIKLGNKVLMAALTNKINQTNKSQNHDKL
jgi:hypothetical protein